MPQTDKFPGVPPPETNLHCPASATTNEDQVLSRLNKNFRLSKAQQILRLLKDQDALNQRFRDCHLLDNGDDSTKEGRHQQREDEDTWSVDEEQESKADDSDLSENEAERCAARHVALRRHRNSIDPGRCKTSMGFYNQAEVTEVPYDTDSDNVAGLDSVSSTPRGLAAGADAAHQPSTQTLQSNTNNSRMRMHHPNVGEGEIIMRNVSIADDRQVLSARSSRPKTSLTSSSSTRSRYYRQQPHPESQSHLSAHHNDHNNLLHPFPKQTCLGETRQAIISRLDPCHPMAVRPFCESRISQEESARAGTQHPPSQPSTPRSGMHQQSHIPHSSHAAVTLYDMTPSFCKDIPVHSTARRPTGAGPQANAPSRSTSFLEHQRMVPAPRTLLSVDSSPIQLQEVSPQGRTAGDDLSGSRRGRLTRVKKRVGEMPRGNVPSSVHVLTERAHPSITIMKLPPLESAVAKGGGGRDLVCVGKH